MRETQLRDLFQICLESPEDRWPDLMAGLNDAERAQLVDLLQTERSQSGTDFRNSNTEADIPPTVSMGEPSPTTAVTDSPRSDNQATGQLGPYRILNKIAEHGQGVVYRADHTHLNRQVVIKVSKNRLDEAEQKVLLEEGRALAALSHPNLAQVYDLQFDNGCPYLVMEYIEGRNLAERIKDARPTPLEAAQLVATLARAMQTAHDVGIIHRDLKPANVVIRSADKTPKIIDFGLARARTAYSPCSQTSTYGGTIPYMAPEQAAMMLDGGPPASGDLTDERIDVFALGAILYELLTGKRLYTFDNQLEGLKQAKACHFDESCLASDQIPSVLRAICLSALAKEPADRTRTATELADALEALAKPEQNKSVPTLVIGIVSVAITGLIFWLARPDTAPDRPGVATVVVTAPEAGTTEAEPVDDLLPGVRFIHFSNSDDGSRSGPLFRNGPVRLDDDLRIEIEFEEAAYCFVFAINPDGAIQLCYPEDQPDLIQRQPVQRISYPGDQSLGFAFTDGIGQQAFVIVQSQEPLPSFNNWKAEINTATESLASSKGKWIWMNGGVHPFDDRQTRGSPRQLRGSEGFEAVMTGIKSSNAEAILKGVSFSVQ